MPTDPDTFFISNETKVINGVTARVVHDTLYVNGVKSEFTDDWFAQDDAGNVCTLENSRPRSVRLSAIRVPGKQVRRRQARIVMEANPKVRDTYFQEQAAPVAKDQATVLSLNQSICVPYGCFKHELETKDFTSLEPASWSISTMHRALARSRRSWSKGIRGAASREHPERRIVAFIRAVSQLICVRSIAGRDQR